MKNLIYLAILTFLFYSTPMHAFTRNIQAGLYHPVNGNNDSICPQEVKPIMKEGILHALKVVYVGDCFYWGPFTYPCDGQVCGDEHIGFLLYSKTSYLWTNDDYHFHATFHWQP